MEPYTGVQSSMSLRTRCILATCSKRISLARQRRNAITCSKRHQKELTRLRKEARDRRICQQCGRPCTASEKTEFRLWRAARLRARGRRHSRKRVAKKGILTPVRGIKKSTFSTGKRPKRQKRDGCHLWLSLRPPTTKNSIPNGGALSEHTWPMAPESVQK